MLFSSVAHAQAAAGAQPSFLETMVPFIFMFVILYFLLIRPQQKKQKTHMNFLSEMKRGDSVLTSGGIFGTIEGLTDRYVTLEIADDVRIRILKTQISSAATTTEESK